jgi:hypothetical protein
LGCWVVYIGNFFAAGAACGSKVAACDSNIDFGEHRWGTICGLQAKASGWAFLVQ